MKKFTISELEQLSGVKAHTIRIWEIRHGFPRPERNLQNLRYYGAAEARRFFQAVLLYRQGWRISKIVTLSDEERRARLEAPNLHEDRYDAFLFELIVLMWEENIEAFERVLDELVLQHGAASAIDEVIAPFLEKTGLLSYRHNSLRVHFAVTALRRKIIYGIESLPQVVAEQKALLFLPKGEHYDLVLLYAFFKLRQQGMGVLYLGSNVDERNIAELLLTRKVDYLYSYLPDTHKKLPERPIRSIASLCAPLPLIFLLPGLPKPSDRLAGVTFRHFRALTGIGDYAP
ncbi:MerR family transcriptional regulator [Flaviaesturariibacter terrae]